MTPHCDIPDGVKVVTKLQNPGPWTAAGARRGIVKRAVEISDI
jgi:hypothetical protein